MNEELKPFVAGFELAGRRLSNGKIQCYGDKIGNDVTEELDEQKFAELIVKECAGVALMSNGNNLYVCELIKEHFGVEE